MSYFSGRLKRNMNSGISTSRSITAAAAATAAAAVEGHTTGARFHFGQPRRRRRSTEEFLWGARRSHGGNKVGRREGGEDSQGRYTYGRPHFFWNFDPPTPV